LPSFFINVISNRRFILVSQLWRNREGIHRIHRLVQLEQYIEAFVRRLVGKVKAAKMAGMIKVQAIVEHFNARGIATGKVRQWIGATVVRCPSSSGAKRQCLGRPGGGAISDADG
jgi:hypothetical protein